MKPNPILEEVWRVKDQLAREAGDDVHQLCENTRQWAAAHPPPGPVVRNVEDWQRILAQQAPAASAIRETPDKPYGI